MAVADYPVFDPDTGGYYDPATGNATSPYTVDLEPGGGGPATGGASTQTVAQAAPDPNSTQFAPPSGLPTAGNVAAMAPAPLQDFGATPTVTPTYANAALVDPNNTPQYLGQEEAANAASLAPTFRQQQQTNQDQLAARGISSSGAAQEITNDLYGNQAAVLAGMNAPAIQQQSGYQQQDLTNNQSNEQGTNLFNAGEGTQASGINAGYYDQALTGNATTYNNYLSTLEGQGYNTSNEAYTAYLNSFGPNSGVTSAYNGAVGAVGNAASGAYDSSVAGEGAAVGGAFGAAGTAIGAKH